MRRVLSLLCVALLAGSLAPAVALAAPAGDECVGGPVPEAVAEAGRGGGDAPEADGPALRLDDIRTADIRTSAEVRSALFALTAQGETALAPGRHAAFIDRIDVPAYARDFYDLLAEASGGDGVDDYLIEDRWFDGASLPEANPAAGSAGSVEGYAALHAGTLPGAGKLGDDERAAASDGAIAALYAVIAAFDRDHPEVFWLAPRVSLASACDGDDLLLFFLPCGSPPSASRGAGCAAPHPAAAGFPGCAAPPRPVAALPLRFAIPPGPTLLASQNGQNRRPDDRKGAPRIRCGSVSS